jgi:hypothetical protein
VPTNLSNSLLLLDTEEKVCTDKHYYDACPIQYDLKRRDTAKPPVFNYVLEHSRNAQENE